MSVGAAGVRVKGHVISPRRGRLTQQQVHHAPRLAREGSQFCDFKTRSGVVGRPPPAAARRLTPRIGSRLNGDSQWVFGLKSIPSTRDFLFFSPQRQRIFLSMFEGYGKSGSEEGEGEG